MIFKIGKDFRKGKEYVKYLLVCKATGDGELSNTQNGKTLGKVNVKAQEKADETPVWMNVLMWGDNGRLVGNIRKGDTLLSVGEVSKREYNGKEYLDFNADFISVMGVGAAFAAAPPPVFNSPADDGIGGAFTDLDDSDGELPF